MILHNMMKKKKCSSLFVWNFKEIRVDMLPVSCMRYGMLALKSTSQEREEEEERIGWTLLSNTGFRNIINRSTFGAIVNKCMSCSQYACSILRGGTPVEI
ncbi:unnamed protein product [Rhizopus stolonifer]